MENLPGNLLKKTWKYHGILSVRKSGNPVKFSIKNKTWKKWEKEKNTVKVIEFCQSGKVGTMKCLLLYTL